MGILIFGFRVFVAWVLSLMLRVLGAEFTSCFWSAVVGDSFLKCCRIYILD